MYHPRKSRRAFHIDMFGGLSVWHTDRVKLSLYTVSELNERTAGGQSLTQALSLPFYVFAHLLNISADHTLCFDFYDASAFNVSKACFRQSVHASSYSST